MPCGPVAGKSEDAVGDLGGPVAGGEDLFEGLVARGLVAMALAHLGVVDDRGQHVVEFVRGRADQLAQGGQLLGLMQAVLEDGDLLFQARRRLRFTA